MFFTKKYKVTVKNKNTTIEVKSGTDLYSCLISNGIALESLCKGDGQCGKCKVKVTSPDFKPITPPTKKEKLILASISVDSGYRLACQYLVKSDIIVDTEEWQKNSDSDSDSFSIIRVNTKSSNQTNSHSDTNDSDDNRFTVKHSEKSENQNNTFESSTSSSNKEKWVSNSTSTAHQEVKTTYKIDQQNTSTDSMSNNQQKAYTKEEHKNIHVRNKGEYHPTDGVILIQYPNRVRYYVYSAGIANISSDGFININEPLSEIIDNNALSDFIHHYIKLENIERVLVILDKKHYDGANISNLINYYSFEIGELSCEILQPEGRSKNLLLFFRLLNSLKERTLVISLDNLANSFYIGDDSIEHLSSAYITDDIYLDNILYQGKNPITDVDSEFSHLTIKDSLMTPDSITLPAMLKIIHNLRHFGIIDEHYILQDRKDLMDRAPLDVLVKLSVRNDKRIFSVFRRKSDSIYIDQEQLDSLNYLKLFLHSIISYTENELGKIESLVLHNMTPYDNVVNEMFNLQMIPAKYAKKVRYFSGDPTILSANFFLEKNVNEYLSHKFLKKYNDTELYKNEKFNSIFKTFEKEFLH